MVNCQGNRSKMRFVSKALVFTLAICIFFASAPVTAHATPVNKLTKIHSAPVSALTKIHSAPINAPVKIHSAPINAPAKMHTAPVSPLAKIQSAPRTALPQLMTAGNRVVYADDPSKTIKLTGLNLSGGESAVSPSDENMLRSAREIAANWNCNLVRLGVDRPGWYGIRQYWGGPDPDDDVAERSSNYKSQIKDIINELNGAGIYVVLDLHEYENPEWETYWSNDYIINYKLPGSMDFWLEVANDPFYANNPGILFGLMNEPAGRVGSWPGDTSGAWKIWRNGEGNYIGHQQLLEGIRAAGAKNIVVAAGLDWGYDLRGIVGLADWDGDVSKTQYAAAGGDTNWYALIDRGPDGDAEMTGYGVIYDTHIYAWKENWDLYAGECRDVFPILCGENGWDDYDLQRQLDAGMSQGIPPHGIWAPMLFDWINGRGVDTGPFAGFYGGEYPGYTYKKYDSPISWTGWRFHPSASPRALQNTGDWNSEDFVYLPTGYWGVYVQNELLSEGRRTPARAAAPLAWELPGANLASLDIDGNPYFSKISYCGEAAPAAAFVYVAAEEVSDFKESVEFKLSLSGRNILALELEFEADGDLLSFLSVDTYGGFAAMQSGGAYGPSAAEGDAGGGVWKGAATIVYTGSSGDSCGFASDAPALVASFRFNAKATGEAAFRLTKINVYGLETSGGPIVDIAAIFKSAEALTSIENIFSRYDLNKDGVVDTRDLSIAALYFQFSDKDEGWSTLGKSVDSFGDAITASMCDFNGDGVVDIFDLAQLFTNYTG